MREPGPSLRSRNLWAKREAKCLAVLDQALLLLRTKRSLPESEVELNRLLYFCLLEASRKLYPGEQVAPVQECNNQPDPDDEARAAREMKRPDFQWVYLDRYEADPNRSCKQFVVECKRVGASNRSDWVLNLNYVIHGVCRFRDPHWAYAKRFQSGAMVGYWQNMDAEAILAEVNSELQKSGFPSISLNGGWKVAGASSLDHHFERTFQVSPFRLIHRWIDVRN